MNIDSEDNKNFIENVIYVLNEATLINVEYLDKLFNFSEREHGLLDYYNVYIECFFLYVHFLNRFAFGILGKVKSLKLPEKILPILLDKFELILKEKLNITNRKLRKKLADGYNEAELDYSKANSIESQDKPFSGKSITTKFANRIISVLGENKYNPATIMGTKYSVEPFVLETLKKFVNQHKKKFEELCK